MTWIDESDIDDNQLEIKLLSIIFLIIWAFLSLDNFNYYFIIFIGLFLAETNSLQQQILSIYIKVNCTHKELNSKILL
jgi:hypothetical protein